MSNGLLHMLTREILPWKPDSAREGSSSESEDPSVTHPLQVHEQQISHLVKMLQF